MHVKGPEYGRGDIFGEATHLERLGLLTTFKGDNEALAGDVLNDRK